MSLQEQDKIPGLPGIFRGRWGRYAEGENVFFPGRPHAGTGRASRGNLASGAAWGMVPGRSAGAGIPPPVSSPREDRKAEGSLCGAGIAGPGGIMASRTGQKDTVRLALRGCENQETAVYRTARMAVSGGSPVRSSLPRVFPGFLPGRFSVPPAGNRDGFLTERKTFII